MSTAEEKVDIAPEAVVSSEEKKTVEPTTEATTTEEAKGETPTVAPTVSNSETLAKFIDSRWAHADFISP